MSITATAPGRICLFGEHQDYLGFPVIAAAIDRTIVIHGEAMEPPRAEVDLPDVGGREEFDLPPDRYDHARDYLRSSAGVLGRRGLLGMRGVRAVVRGNIPIQSGTSSSSALVVAWIGFLLAAAGHTEHARLLDPGMVAELAYTAEVIEFNESGGRMDHYASACGGVIFLEMTPRLQWESLPSQLGEFVLGDSRQPKDTLKTLTRLRHGQDEGLRQLMTAAGVVDRLRLTTEHLSGNCLHAVSREWRDYAQAAVENHWITRQARTLLKEPNPDIQALAVLMNRLQGVLRDKLRVSTPRLNAMIDASLESGALAAKINGSGEGGCMFAWCPGKQDEVCEAINREGGNAMAINIGPGLRIDMPAKGVEKSKA